MFTPYYFLAVGFGVYAVLVSVIGMKRPNDFPGRFMGLIILGGVLIGIATFAMVWRGGEKEVEHREHEEAGQMHKTSSTTTLPAGVKSTS